MTPVITVPPSLDDETFEQVFEQVAAVSADQKILVDARHTRWASPYGLTALLALGQSRAEQAAFMPLRTTLTWADRLAEWPEGVLAGAGLLAVTLELLRRRRALGRGRTGDESSAH